MNNKLTLEDYGVTEIRVDKCGTCGDHEKLAVFAGDDGITLCHDCLVDLANLLFDMPSPETSSARDE